MRHWHQSHSLSLCRFYDLLYPLRCPSADIDLAETWRLRDGGGPVKKIRAALRKAKTESLRAHWEEALDDALRSAFQEENDQFEEDLALMANQVGKALGTCSSRGHASVGRALVDRVLQLDASDRPRTASDLLKSVPYFARPLPMPARDPLAAETDAEKARLLNATARSTRTRFTAAPYVPPTGHRATRAAGHMLIDSPYARLGRLGKVPSWAIPHVLPPSLDEAQTHLRQLAGPKAAMTKA